MLKGSSGQDGGLGRDASPHYTMMRRSNTTNLKMKTPGNARKSPRKTPRKCGKSDNKRFKEAILIQVVRKVGDRGFGAERTWCGSEEAVAERWQGGHGGWNRQCHIHVWWVKSQETPCERTSPAPRLDHAAQGSSTGKIKPHNFFFFK